MTFWNVLEMAAGLVFFLFGMNTMSSSLEKMAGGKLESILKKMTANPFISIVLGAVITIAVQSSSATTVMLVGLVNSGLMNFANTVCVLFGANIGTTLTSWLLALSGIEGSPIVQMLKPEYFSPILAVIGIGFIMVSKSDKKKNLGTIFVGFTVLIYGMGIMSDSVSGLADSPQFSEVLLKFNNPILGVLVGTVFTAIIQSSAASVGILQALSLTGGISYTMAIPIVLGQNIGTCATGLISCIGANAKAKRVAVVQTFINVAGTIVFLSLYVLLNHTIGLSFADKAVNPGTIALIHTVFNVLTVTVLLPFHKFIAKFCEKIVPEKADKEEKKVEVQNVVHLDDRLLRSPSVAIMECDNKTVQMANIAKETIMDSLVLLFDYRKDLAEKVFKNEDVLDKYEDGLGTYLVKLSSQSLSNNDARTISRMLHTIGDFERLGDHALNLEKVALEIRDKQVKFSEQAQKEIKVLLEAITEIVVMTTLVYEKNDTELASKIEPLEQVIDNLAAEIKSHHINRLRQGNCTIEVGFVLSDLLTNCERISDHCSNIAVAVIEAKNDTFDTHMYLNSIKYDNENFKTTFAEYKAKYDLHAER